MIQPGYYLSDRRNDWPELQSHFDVEGYNWDGFMFFKKFKVAPTGTLLVMFELTSICQCHVYCYEAPHSENNDLARPRLYRKKIADWDQLPKDELIELIHQSSKAIAQWEAWMNNYELEQILETL